MLLQIAEAELVPKHFTPAPIRDHHALQHRRGHSHQPKNAKMRPANLVMETAQRVIQIAKTQHFITVPQAPAMQRSHIPPLPPVHRQKDHAIVLQPVMAPVQAYLLAGEAVTGQTTANPG